MELQGINIIQHPSLSPEDVWIIHKNEAPQVPPDLWGKFTVPFVLTGDAERARQLISFVGTINGATRSRE